MMTLTWPGQMKPSMRTSPPASRASIAGTTHLWAERIEKFLRPSLAAISTATAVPGAVVSKPTAAKTTCWSGCWRARSSASRTE